MKKNIFFIASLIVLFSGCKDSTNSNKGVILATSSGHINALSIIIDDTLWQGKVGELLRNKLAAPVAGLPQQEPLFSINHIPPKAFSGFVRKSRIFIKIQPKQKAAFHIAQDTFARPQTAVFISGTPNEIIKLLEKKSPQIIRSLKRTEIKEKQRRISKSLKSDTVLRKRLGVSLEFSNAYRYAKKTDDFVWIRKDIPHGSMEICVYQVPMNVIDKDTNVVGNIIKMRDSISKEYIPGPEKDKYMITEKAYAPYLFKTKINGKFAYETKGTWEIKGAFMAGPFVNYAVRDPKNNRYLVLEGFVFKPQAPTKRDNIFELEAILQSAKFK